MYEKIFMHHTSPLPPSPLPRRWLEVKVEPRALVRRAERPQRRRSYHCSQPPAPRPAPPRSSFTRFKDKNKLRGKNLIENPNLGFSADKIYYRGCVGRLRPARHSRPAANARISRSSNPLAKFSLPPSLSASTPSSPSATFEKHSAVALNILLREFSQPPKNSPLWPYTPKAICPSSSSSVLLISYPPLLSDWDISLFPNLPQWWLVLLFQNWARLNRHYKRIFLGSHKLQVSIKFSQTQLTSVPEFHNACAIPLLTINSARVPSAQAQRMQSSDVGSPARTPFTAALASFPNVSQSVLLSAVSRLHRSCTRVTQVIAASTCGF
ncbi:hypothetical protein EVAR_78392_1 [Eumeta japonica]|uniref:Uncharacterized protein n=1 Tax=Eumeta variegata TaxID=151549 RepID=A0A4C1T6J1_EUMVA|nr:hypothetical protein EVAR_78392_1 [Eumeta japonica]